MHPAVTQQPGVGIVRHPAVIVPDEDGQAAVTAGEWPQRRARVADQGRPGSSPRRAGDVDPDDERARLGAGHRVERGRRTAEDLDRRHAVRQIQPRQQHGGAPALQQRHIPSDQNHSFDQVGPAGLTCRVSRAGAVGGAGPVNPAGLPGVAGRGQGSAAGGHREGHRVLVRAAQPDPDGSPRWQMGRQSPQMDRHAVTSLHERRRLHFHRPL